MKRILFLIVLSVSSGLLLLPACSSSSDSTDSTIDSSVSSIPSGNIVITADQAATLVGKTESVAEAEARAKGWVWRIGSRDGEQFALTMDYCECRVTVAIENDIVTDAVVG